MNILIVPSWYATKDNPVLGSFFREQALALSARGHNVSLAYVSLCPRTGFISKDHFHIKKYNDNGVNVYTYSIPSFGVERNKKLFFSLYYSRYKKLINTIIDDGHSIDVIHAHSFYPAGYTATLLKRYFKIPIVVTEHLSAIPLETLNDEKIKYLERTVTNSDRFICVSKFLKDAVIKLTHTGDDIYIVPNVLSPLFNYKEASIEKNSDTFTFISIGALIEIKRFSILISAFAEAFATDKSVTLEIIGEGSQREALEFIIESKGLQDNVVLHGRLSREETANKLRSSDAFVLVSSVETFGVVYIEAMASGLPVIASKNGGAETIVSEDDGILVDIDDIEQLKNTLIYMRQNVDKYKSNEISSRCIEMYSEKVISNQLVSVYSEAIEGGNNYNADNKSGLH